MVGIAVLDMDQRGARMHQAQGHQHGQRTPADSQMRHDHIRIQTRGQQAAAFDAAQAVVCLFCQCRCGQDVVQHAHHPAGRGIIDQMQNPQPGH